MTIVIETETATRGVSIFGKGLAVSSRQVGLPQRWPFISDGNFLSGHP